MTQKEMDAAMKTLPTGKLLWKDWTDAQRQLSNEISCRSMINSCLTYGGIGEFWRESEWRTGDKSYATPYIRALGLERVEQLVKEQEADFARARVFRNTYVDSEGVSYNSVVWADEA